MQVMCEDFIAHLNHPSTPEVFEVTFCFIFPVLFHYQITFMYMKVTFFFFFRLLLDFIVSSSISGCFCSNSQSLSTVRQTSHQPGQTNHKPTVLPIQKVVFQHLSKCYIFSVHYYDLCPFGTYLHLYDL